jgi:hypothetical protein
LSMAMPRRAIGVRYHDIVEEILVEASIITSWTSWAKVEVENWCAVRKCQ